MTASSSLCLFFRFFSSSLKFLSYLFKLDILAEFSLFLFRWSKAPIWSFPTL